MDGPGHRDTGGPEVDISNIVAMDYIFKSVCQLIPILFIDYPLFNVLHGADISKLIQGFCTMFSNEVDLLEKHMVVVWTKVPENVTLEKISQKVDGTDA